MYHKIALLKCTVGWILFHSQTWAGLPTICVVRELGKAVISLSFIPAKREVEWSESGSVLTARGVSTHWKQ